MEQLLPIYEYAEKLEQENPEYRYVVSHYYTCTDGDQNSEKVCGLHVKDNLVLKKLKRRKDGGFSLKDLR